MSGLKRRLKLCGSKCRPVRGYTFDVASTSVCELPRQQQAMCCSSERLAMHARACFWWQKVQQAQKECKCTSVCKPPWQKQAMSCRPREVQKELQKRCCRSKDP
eukprot:1161769-Pelagomonas_calceolata.AAC.7